MKKNYAQKDVSNGSDFVPGRKPRPISRIKSLLTLLILTFFTYSVHAQCGACITDSIVINTGYNPIAGTAITLPTTTITSVMDPEWKVESMSTALSTALTGQGYTLSTAGIPTPNAYVIKIEAPWVACLPGSTYISCFNSNGFSGSLYPAYWCMFYREFQVCAADSFTVDFLLANDNYVDSIMVEQVGGAGIWQISTPGAMPQGCCNNYAAYQHYKRTMYLTPGTYRLKLRLNQDWGPLNGLGMCVVGAITSPTRAGHGAYAAISGADSICTGAAVSLTGTTAGGTWSVTNGSGSATITSTGSITGVTGGTVTVHYTVSDSCGWASATKLIYVRPLPTITGHPICVGDYMMLTSSMSGGTWSIGATTPVVASISGIGIVTGISAGTALVTYTDICGRNVTYTVTVEAAPPILGPPVICIGGTVTYTNTVSGTWNSTGSAIVPINASTGTTTGVTTGTAVITFTSVNGCRTTKIVTVTPLPVINGDSMCVGDSRTLHSSTAGGTWTSGDGLIATIGASSGIVSGVGAGTAAITYTDSCGNHAYNVVTVNAAAAITGDSVVCIGSTIALHNTEAGAWNTGDADITIGAGTGIVTGVTAGTAIVTFTNVHGCMATTIVTVLPLPVITGSPVCAGSTTTLTSSDPVGTWTSSYTETPVIDSVTGVVTGVTAGTVVITFTGSCTTTYTLTVIPLPTITGPSEVCPGTTTTMYGSPGTGTWSGGNANASVADIGGGMGEVTGVMAGTVLLTYTDGTGCVSTVIVAVHCPCAALDSAATTLTSTVDYGEQCKFTCTAATATINGWTIAGYLWQIGGGAGTWVSSTANTDVQSVGVTYSGTELVTVTFYAVDSTGDTCTLIRTLNLSCDRQPCYYEDATDLSVTTTTDGDGNCSYTATASVSTAHTILGYEWSYTGSVPTVVHTSASSDVYTFSLPPGGAATVTVIVHIVDPFFEAGTSPCCDATLSKYVSCGDTVKQPCACFNEIKTTIGATQLSAEECNGRIDSGKVISSSASSSSGVGQQGKGCCYKVTVTAGMEQDCKITGYSWDVDGVITWVPSTSYSDDMIITVPGTGTVVVHVTITAIDAYGQECHITKTIELSCDCNCFINSTISYVPASQKECDAIIKNPSGIIFGDGIPLANNCCYKVTVSADLNPNCKIDRYIWNINGAVSVVMSTATSDAQVVSVPAGGSVVITVTIIAIDEHGNPCVVVKTTKIACGCICFNDQYTTVTYVPTDVHPRTGCAYVVTAHASVNQPCKVISYVWQAGVSAPVTVYTSATSYSMTYPVPAYGTLTVTVTINAIDADGNICSITKPVVLTCGTKPGCCFDEEATNVTNTSVMTSSRLCQYDIIGNYAFIDPRCRFIGYIWHTSTGISTGIVSTNSIHVMVSGMLSGDVTFIAVKPTGETCTVVRPFNYKCPGRLGRSAGESATDGDDNGGQAPGEKVSIFPNPTSDGVTVSSTQVDIQTIQVIDVNGRKVGNYTFEHAKTANISLNTLVPGTYLLRINNEISKVVTKAE